MHHKRDSEKPSARTDVVVQPPRRLEIQEPCPKTWALLAGGERKRHCEQCDLHVHNSAALTRAEAIELVAGSTERVCMRIVQDATGTPVFLDSPQPALVAARRAAGAPGRLPSWCSPLPRWVSALAAGLIAIFYSACQPNGASPDDSGGDSGPGGGDSACSTDRLGEVALPMERVGDVAWTPEPQDPPAEIVGRVAATAPADPAPEPEPVPDQSDQ